VGDWSFLTTHAEVLLCIASDPGIRLRDIGDTVGITERRAYSVVADLAQAGYIVKEREGRRTRYQLRPDLPITSPLGREKTIGELLELLL
jgi:DNA-binding MarR family transcriptional regulator